MIKKLIFDRIQKYISKPFADRKPFKSFINVKSLPIGYYKSFGTRNPDKTFYVIWLDGRGSGFFSNVSSVLCHLKIAKDNEMIPIIDFQNFPTLYNEKDPISNTLNSWEYYFKPVNKYTFNEVYKSKNVLFSTGLYPAGMNYSVTQNPGLYSIYKQNIKIQSDVIKKIKDYESQFNFNQKILGIHFRGQEQKYAAGHSFPPTEKQMLKYTDEILQKYHIDKIFLVTEDSSYLKLFIDRYGDKVLYTDMFRVHGTNAYKLRPRKHHMYLLGREVLVDTILLSKCTGILCGDSNVSELARFINNKKYKFTYIIDNGVNSKNPIIARHLYDIKKILPQSYGGFNEQLSRIKHA